MNIGRLDSQPFAVLSAQPAEQVGEILDGAARRLANESNARLQPLDESG